MGMNFRQFLNEQFAKPDRTTPSEPGFAYHASNQENLHDIKAAGSLNTFRPWHGTDQQEWPDGSTDKRSYWSQHANLVWQFAPAEGIPVVIRTPLSPVFRKESTGDLYATKKIPAANLQVLLDNGQWVPVMSI